MPRDLAKYFGNKNFIIIYPEQRAFERQALSSSLDGLENTSISNGVERFSGLAKMKKTTPENRHNTMTE
jgi:hypothetical protein